MCFVWNICRTLRTFRNSIAIAMSTSYKPPHSRQQSQAPMKSTNQRYRPHGSEVRLPPTPIQSKPCLNTENFPALGDSTTTTDNFPVLGDSTKTKPVDNVHRLGDTTTTKPVDKIPDSWSHLIKKTEDERVQRQAQIDYEHKCEHERLERLEREYRKYQGLSKGIPTIRNRGQAHPDDDFRDIYNYKPSEDILDSTYSDDDYDYEDHHRPLDDDDDY